jgi:hypothetical protein
MRVVDKPWVERHGNTIIGFDPGDRESSACRVTMVLDPKTGVITVTKLETWPRKAHHKDK